jgi:glycine hydroxymethyltransferase
MDSTIKKLIQAETKRQLLTLDLIPSENIASAAVREALGSVLTNKYSEGYPAKRYYAGNRVIDEIETLAQERARKVFRLGEEWGVNVQALSGAAANIAVYAALLKPGDALMGMALASGGHLTHGDPVSISGKLFRGVQYGVGKDEYIDYVEVFKLARREKPRLIVAGASAYPRTIDFRKFAEIAEEVGAYFMVDMAHIAGLVAADAHPSPFPHADIVTTTTHKTLRGPRGALIFSLVDRVIPSRKKDAKKTSIARAIDSAVFPGLQGGPHDNQTAAIAVALGEAMRPGFKKYGRQIIKNAALLAALLAGHGFRLVSGGTDNHLMLIDLTPLGIFGRAAQDTLEEAGLIVNRNRIPFDTRSPFDPSGIRLGTPSVTTRSMKEKEMAHIARWIHELLHERRKPTAVKKEVEALCRKFPIK